MAPLTEIELRPYGQTDLRGSVAVPGLRYPAGAVVVIAGIPGAGKSTMMHALFGTTGAEPGPAITTGGVRVVDSEQARNWWRQLLGTRLPYWLYRPLVHLTALLWARSALRGGRHRCRTRLRHPALVAGVDRPMVISASGRRALCPARRAGGRGAGRSAGSQPTGSAAGVRAASAGLAGDGPGKRRAHRSRPRPCHVVPGTGPGGGQRDRPDHLHGLTLSPPVLAGSVPARR